MVRGLIARGGGGGETVPAYLIQRRDCASCGKGKAETPVCKRCMLVKVAGVGREKGKERGPESVQLLQFICPLDPSKPFFNYVGLSFKCLRRNNPRIF